LSSKTYFLNAIYTITSNSVHPRSAKPKSQIARFIVFIGAKPTGYIGLMEAAMHIILMQIALPISR